MTIARNSTIIELDPRRVKPFPDQPRKRFRGIPKLAESIKTIGQVTPVIVTESDEPQYDAVLVDGDRRLRACLTAEIPVRAVFEDGDKDRFAQSIAANFCRQDHDPVEIMEAVSALKDRGYTLEKIASIVGKTVTWVKQYLSLHRLAPEILDAMKWPDDAEKRSRDSRRQKGKFTLSLALLVAPFPHDVQVEMATRIRKYQMSMAAARTFVKRYTQSRGVEAGKRQSPYKQFKTLHTAVTNCRHVVDRYLNMPGVKIKPLIDAAGRSERRELAETLESLCESLLMFADALTK